MNYIREFEMMRDVAQAAIDGKKLQFRNEHTEWNDINGRISFRLLIDYFESDFEIRVKPEPKEIKLYFAVADDFEHVVHIDKEDYENALKEGGKGYFEVVLKEQI